MLPYKGEQTMFHIKLYSFILKLRYTVIVLVKVGAQVGDLTRRTLFL
jgi:hypothetical protein